MISLLMIGSMAFGSAEKDRIHGFRIGACGGFSTECMVGSLKLEYAGKYIGANISMPLLPAWIATSVRVYPISIREGDKVSWRPYACVGGSAILMAAAFSGGGVGTDVHLTESRRLCLQPSTGVITDGNEYFASGALGVMYTF